MKVAITEIKGLQEYLLAMGLTALIGQLDRVAVDGTPVLFDFTVPDVVEAAIPAPAPVAAVPAKRKPGKASREWNRAVSPGAAEAAAPPSDPPRLTIRARIIALLKSGPKCSGYLTAELVRQGLAESALSGIYPMKTDGLVAFDSSDDTWSLTPKGEARSV